MSSFIAEASVVIRPIADPKAFAAAINEAMAAAQAAVKPVVIPVTSVATGASAAGVAASEEAARGARQQAAAATITTGQNRALAASQSNVTRSALALAKSEEVAATRVGAVAKANAVATQTARAQTLAEAALAEALVSKNLQQEISAAAAVESATAQNAAAQAALKEAVAQAEAAGAVSANARAHGQLARGAEATALSQLGIRGATLAASSAFLAGAAAITITIKSIQAASDETEQLNKSVVVFASSAEEIKKWSETTATAMGISRAEALATSSTFGQLFRTLGVGPERAVVLSESLVQLGSDLASFNNVPVDRALKALQSGLVGQARPLRQLGIFLTEARVRQEAFLETGKRTASELTQQDKILARYNLILRDARFASGDFERTQSRLANQGRILTAQIGDLAAQIGNILIPAVTTLTQDVNLAIQAFRRLGDIKIKVPKLPETTSGGLFGQINDFLGGVPKNLVTNLGPNVLFPGLAFNILVWKDLNRVLRIAAGVQDENTRAAKRVSEGVGEEAAAIRGLGAAVVTTTVSLKGLSHAQDVLTQQQEQIQAGVLPGGRSAEEANIKKQIAVQQQIIDTAKVGSKAYRDALREKARLMDELASLQAQDAADAEKRASDAKAAAAAAAQAQADATQAFIDGLFSRQEAVLQNRLLKAANTSDLGDDIRINQGLVRLYKRRIEAIKARIRNMHLHGEALKIARAAIAQITKLIASTNADIARMTADAAESARSARQTHLEALLSIAETTPGIGDDRKALNALIAFDKAQIARLLAIKRKRKLTQEEQAELDAYRVDLAQRNKALKDLTAESKKSVSEAQKLQQAEFAFLQTLTGFTANLIGNLIPGGATAGLVGGGAGRAAVTAPENAAPRQVPGGFEQPRGMGTPAPASAGQSERQIDWLHKIWQEVHKLNRSTDHPEAKHQRNVGSAVGDAGGGGKLLGM